MSVKFFDSHTHINNETYSDAQRSALGEEITASNVAYAMDVAFDLKSSMQAVKDAEKYPWCYAVVGCHPHDVKDMDDMTLELIKGLTKKPKVQAIGEIGLDYYRNLSPKDLQQYWFRKQIKLANELKLPIVIHTREAAQDTMEILKEEGAFSQERKNWFPKRKLADGSFVDDARVLLHCYSGGYPMAKEYIDLGATISLAGPLTYKNNKKGVEVGEKISMDYLLIETDAPYLTPEPLRGKPNKSPYVEHTARRLAIIKGISLEAVAEKTLENGKFFFNIK